jgi:YD repeat-containing protein
VLTDYDGISGSYSYQYDAFGHATQQALDGAVDENGYPVVTVSSYHPTFGRLNTYTDGENRTTTLGRNAVGLIETVTDALGHQTHYTWVDGLRTAVTDKTGDTTQYEYDAHRRLVCEGAHGTSGTIGKSRSTSLMFSKRIPSESLIA